MPQIATDLTASSPADLNRMLPDAAEAEALFRAHQEQIYRRTDRLFAHLMVAQWVAGIIFALWVSPRAWTGSTSQTHVHVWAAVFLGGAISIFPATLALLQPGRASTRYTIATAQMLMSALLIHLTGGRIETHFHVFGSPREDSDVEQTPARADQRHPRLVKNRGGQDGAGPADLRDPSDAQRIGRRHRRCDSAEWQQL
jgi:hypothetical protein